MCILKENDKIYWIIKVGRKWRVNFFLEFSNSGKSLMLITTRESCGRKHDNSNNSERVEYINNSWGFN